MANYQGFIGGSATVRSRNVNSERTVNWYIEQPPGTAKVPSWLVPTPGVAPFAVLGNGPVRGLLSVNGRVFAVGGAGFYEVFVGGTSTYWGAVATNAQPASLSTNGTNGNQVFIVSGGSGYIFDLTTDTLSLITAVDFPSPAIMGAFSDGYFLVLKGQSNQFQTSALYDGTSWDALDTYQVSTVAEHIVTMLESHRDIWLFGEQTTSVWANTGDADTPYQPIGGVKIDQGSAAPFGAARIDNAIIWLGQSELGTRMVFRANGYTPQRVSTHAVEYALSQVARIEDAIAWAYQEEGHSFYCLYLPEGETTWCYDIASGLWHERALWDSVFLRWRPHPARCVCFGFGRTLVGDRSSGAIYEMRLGLGTDTVVAEGSFVGLSPSPAVPRGTGGGTGETGGGEVVVVPGPVPPPSGGSTPEPAPFVSVANASGTEGDVINVTISLSAVWTEDVTVSYATSDSTATAGTDYTAVSGSTTITAGDTTATIPVTTALRSGYNGARRFTVTISEAIGGPNDSVLTISDASATVTIADTEAPATDGTYYATITALPEAMAEHCYTLRDQTQLDGLVPGLPNTTWTYAPGSDDYADARDGAKFYLPGPNSNGQQLWIDFSPRLAGTSAYLFTWDWYWGQEYRENRGGVNFYKMFQVMMDGHGWWTLMSGLSWASSSDTDEVGKAWDSFRAGTLADGVVQREPWHPAGADTPDQRNGSGTQYAQHHSVWTRYWIEIKMPQAPSSFTEWSAEYLGGATLGDNPNDPDGKWLMVSLWMADEGRDAQRLLFRAPIGYSGTGDWQASISRFRFEMNTSQGGPVLDGPLVGYARNFAVLQDYALPATPEDDTTLFQRPVP